MAPHPPHPLRFASHISHHVRWAESWTKARGHQSPERTAAYFDALGRSAHLADWQFRQAVDAARILACDVLAIPWASSFDWQGLSDQARSLGPNHRTLARESIQVRATLSTVAGTTCSSPSQGQPVPDHSLETAPPSLETPDSGSSHSGDLQADIHTLIDSLRRAIRLKGYTMATEESYVSCIIRYARFCHERLGISPQDAGIAAISPYLDYLALERNVAAATQNQALNAIAFLVKHVFGIPEFTLEGFTRARGNRRPPTVMTREEVRSVIAHLAHPWKLAAQLMYGSGLRLMECMKLRVKDLDFGQGTITIHDGMGGPGFWGLRCRLSARTFWIVYRLWSADGWVTIDNHLVESSLIGDEKKHIPKERRVDSACLIGARIVSYEIDRDSSTLTLEDREGGVRRIVLRMDGSVVPPWRGNGKKKQFSDGESLEDAVIVSKGGRLWTTD